MAQRTTENPISARVTAVTNRLREPLWWFPMPLFLPLGLGLVLTAHVLSGTNQRMGNPADIITFPSTPQRDSALWMAVTPIGDEIVVTTGDRRIFRWPEHVSDLTELAPFIAYLKGRVANEIGAAALMKQAFSTQTSAVIAADQRLKFLHMRPILHALAAAGISRYAFETQNPVTATASPSAESGREPTE